MMVGCWLRHGRTRGVDFIVGGRMVDGETVTFVKLKYCIITFHKLRNYKGNIVMTSTLNA